MFMYIHVGDQTGMLVNLHLVLTWILSRYKYLLHVATCISTNVSVLQYLSNYGTRDYLYGLWEVHGHFYCDAASVPSFKLIFNCCCRTAAWKKGCTKYRLTNVQQNKVANCFVDVHQGRCPVLSSSVHIFLHACVVNVWNVVPV